MLAALTAPLRGQAAAELSPEEEAAELAWAAAVEGQVAEAARMGEQAAAAAAAAAQAVDAQLVPSRAELAAAAAARAPRLPCC